LAAFLDRSGWISTLDHRFVQLVVAAYIVLLLVRLSDSFDSVTVVQGILSGYYNWVLATAVPAAVVAHLGVVVVGVISWALIR